MIELLTVSEVASKLRVDDTTVRRWVKQGIFPCVFLPMTGKRENRHYRIRRTDLDAIVHPAQGGAR